MFEAQNTILANRRLDASQVYTIVKSNIFPAPWLWALVAALCLVDALAIVTNPRLSFTLGPLVSAILPMMGFMPLFIWRLSKSTPADNVFYGRMLQFGLMVLFLVPAMASLAVFNHVVMTYPFPLVDGMLNHWDGLLGFDWLAFGRLIAHFPIVNFALDQSYQLMFPTMILVGLNAILSGRKDIANELLALVVTTGILVISLAAFFPAVGAMELLADASFKAMFSENAGNSFVPQLLEIRTNQPVLISPLFLAGLAEFPSFHSVCSILIIYGSRANRVSLVLGTILGSCMIAATPTFGGHYLVDVIAGAPIALGAIFIARRLARNATGQ